MWFLTIESIALLAIATTLGLFSGWLVWGGRPAVIAATPAMYSSALVPIPSVSDLTPSDDDEDDFDAAFPAARILEAAKAEKARKLHEAARLTAAEIDPESAALALEDSVLETAQDSPKLADEAQDAFGSQPHVDQPRGGNSEAHAWSALRAEQPTQLETKFTNVTNTAQLRLAELETDLADINERLATREADVVRLKAKLRKAVEEIEKRTALAQTARAELVDYQQRLAQRDHESSFRPQQALAADSANDDFGPTGTRFTPAEIDELVQARTASLHIQTSQLERRTALIQSRAEEAEALVVALKAEAAHHQVEAESILAKAEHDANNRILALEVDLASARQRTNMATQELMGFGSEISAIRDTNAKHLQSVHETMQDLQHRLDTTKAALAGRSISSVKAPDAEAPMSDSSGLESSSLLVLPGTTATLVEALGELGITSLADVAVWTAEDVKHIQSLLPEDPEVVERNGWVLEAQRRLRETSAPTEV